MATDMLQVLIVCVIGLAVILWTTRRYGRRRDDPFRDRDWQ